jgi:hypothetical protein
VTYSRREFIAASATAAAAVGLSLPAQPADASGNLLQLPDMPLHDPFIYADAETDTYYLYTSNIPSMTGVSAVGTMVYRSRNLRDWQPPVVVFKTQQGMWATDGAWAPEVHRYRGKYYLFTTLHNAAKPLPIPPANPYGLPVQLPNYMRGTIIAVSDSLLGPFTPLDRSRPTPPSNFMTLDGTFYVDPDGQPWMVYAHEWLQKIDGTVEAIRLTPDLSETIGDPIYLFKGSDAFWLTEDMAAPSVNQIIPYVTDGPEVYRMADNSLVMLWSTYEKNINVSDGTVSGTYVETYAVARSGRLEGPWEQQRPLVRQDSGHGMLFHVLNGPDKGKLMMILHRPFNNARGKLYEMRSEGSALRVLRQRTDLDGGD